ncbi:MAG: iron-sulfur cluster assembly accessory protein, partial [bacterium]|nr:iron-sulfur cluster assembly accessory protein [bacterium]
ISPPAANEILKLIETNSSAVFMRVGIKGGGCSGFSYNYALEKTAKASDLIFSEHGVSILVDPKSMKLIGGSLLEWHNEMGSKGFRLRNKQTSKSCSCGQSFSL